MLNCNTELNKSQEIIKRISAKQTEKYKYLHRIKLIADKEGYADSTIKGIAECGTYIGVTTSGKIKEANFCKNRLCAICAWRKSYKTFGRVIKIVNKEKKYIFLTLTQENCKVSELSEELDRLAYAFKKFKQSALFKELASGYIKTTEVTYNRKNNTFHPHIHVIVEASEGYYVDKYVSNKSIKELWKRVVGKEVKMTRIQAIKGDNLEKAVAEVSKYTIKINNVLSDTTDEALAEVFESLKNRRMFTLGGSLRRRAALLKIDFDKLEDEEETEEELKRFVYINGKYTELTNKKL